MLLVGTVHLDPDGGEKLTRLLEAVQPACITVEVSRWGLLFRARRGPKLLEQIEQQVEGKGKQPTDAIRAVRAQLQVPFEYSASRSYAEIRGLPAVPVDLSRISHVRLQAFEEICSEDNLGQLLDDQSFSLSRSIMEQHLLARRYRYDRHMFAWHFRQEEKQEMADRAEQMLRCIRGRLQRTTGTLVHVGGWHHLVQPEEGGLVTLATLLEESSGISWRGMLLGDPPPAPWTTEEDQGIQEPA